MGDVRFELPTVVTLPEAAIIDHQHLRVALADPSKQLLALWRRERHFPKSFGNGSTSYCLTADVADWLERNGVTVRRI